MIRTVFDTNIYLSALLFGGTCAELRNLARKGKIEVFVCEAILAEVAGVLRRKFGWNHYQISLTLAEIRSFTTVIFPLERVEVIIEDPADNRVLECALEAKAEYVISGDRKHLLPLKEFQGIRIVSPREFLELFVSRKVDEG
ncbi:putative toxin-antitoxin system toxin component, PIN family [Thermosulfurimonas dismutans]|uniref:PIN domain-containing protein n=1 Tax=Thermosulfurimonas dismutans TaxID=999894 RepID=A0A179D417_9BACT|nr:putative toxin-antitoxin system toxin component, PIN family [Thermosulfurimonas dismutans]OAQ20551.1 hypothetical protein TDIS_1320 [Thermosulfurimonas dismutans]